MGKTQEMNAAALGVLGVSSNRNMNTPWAGLPLTPLQCLMCALIWVILHFFDLTLEDYTLPCCSNTSEDGDVFFALFFSVTRRAVTSFSFCVPVFVNQIFWLS